MGAIITVVGIVGIMYVGLFLLANQVREKFKAAFSAPTSSTGRVGQITYAESNAAHLAAHCDVILQALELNGYNKKSRSGHPEYVDDPVVAGMFTELDADDRLEWLLPPLGLRLKTMPSDAPAELKATYGWVVITSSHAIGIHRHT